MEKILAVLLSWLLGAPIYLPWLLARLGHYKRRYLAPFIPPFSWRRWIQLWPGSAFFICYPLIGLSPLSDDAVMTLWAMVGVAGIVLALIMVILNPRWAKPPWQRWLEDLFSHEEINSFIKSWRQMDFAEWSRLIETEEGVKKLVRMAAASQYDDRLNG